MCQENWGRECAAIANTTLCAWDCRDIWFRVVLFFLLLFLPQLLHLLLLGLSLLSLVILKIGKKTISFWTHSIVFFRKKIIFLMGELFPSYRKKKSVLMVILQPEIWSRTPHAIHPHTVTAVESNGCNIATWPVAIVITGDSLPLLTVSLSDNNVSFAVAWKNNKVYLLQRQQDYRLFSCYISHKFSLEYSIIMNAKCLWVLFMFQY